MITRARPSLWNRYRELRLASLAESPEMFGSSWERESAFGEDVWRGRASHPGAFIASIDDADVGIGGVYEIDGRWSINGVWVSPAHRGQGVVDALVEACAEFVVARGADAVHLGVIDSNARGVAAYTRLGFVPDGASVTLRDGRVEIMMTRSLSGEGGQPRAGR
ncbi:GNAT family N-acetyltransferase [Microbacterium sp.]|uniref:GNAT family N-acetyltransferase n=1 Tax=Microbacterium sp. TaxID=51671 RepID=UPI0035679D8C